MQEQTVGSEGAGGGGGGGEVVGVRTGGGKVWRSRG